ncbi:uncharacterized protein LOC17890423 [Capsella rubella]|uniref:uncharacterized protein LOC17890423 n=1 Tax=Capsella rubella TaxID=81985 RepID=UPI000CD50CD8|nr:uncharacterized protein LOC17890423 [Capsella rubella]
MENEGDLRATVRDATMMVIGEKEHPPGDPPDSVGTWAQRAAGGSAGGRVVPESVLKEEFVEARLSLEFPDGEDGEPVFTVGEENISIAAMSRRLKEMWKPKGAMHVLDLPRQFFMARFEHEEEYLEALTGGPWRMFGSYLMVCAWSPEFDPVRHEIMTTPVLVRVSNIPVIFYHKMILMGMAQGLGRPLKVDLNTMNIECARFARICVEVDLRKPLKGAIMINGDRYFVSYEGLNSICSGCGVYGHLVHSCPRRALEKEVVLTAPREMELPQANTGGGWFYGGATEEQRVGSIL